jgi:hypothetical protein
LRYRLDAEPELLDEYPDADLLLNSVNLGRGSFMELIANGQADIAHMQQVLAA